MNPHQKIHHSPAGATLFSNILARTLCWDRVTTSCGLRRFFFGSADPPSQDASDYQEYHMFGLKDPFLPSLWHWQLGGEASIIPGCWQLIGVRLAVDNWLGLRWALLKEAPGKQSEKNQWVIASWRNLRTQIWIDLSLEKVQNIFSQMVAKNGDLPP